MSATSVLSMAFAGIAGDLVGVRNVFFLAGAIVAIGAVISIVGYRGDRRTSPVPGTDAHAAASALATD